MTRDELRGRYEDATAQLAGVYCAEHGTADGALDYESDCPECEIVSLRAERDRAQAEAASLREAWKKLADAVTQLINRLRELPAPAATTGWPEQSETQRLLGTRPWYRAIMSDINKSGGITQRYCGKPRPCPDHDREPPR